MCDFGSSRYTVEGGWRALTALGCGLGEEPPGLLACTTRPFPCLPPLPSACPEEEPPEGGGGEGSGSSRSIQGFSGADVAVGWNTGRCICGTNRLLGAPCVAVCSSVPLPNTPDTSDGDGSSDDQRCAGAGERRLTSGPGGTGGATGGGGPGWGASLGGIGLGWGALASVAISDVTCTTTSFPWSGTRLGRLTDPLTNDSRH